MYWILFFINTHANLRLMFHFLAFMFNLKEKTTHAYSIAQHNYPFPAKASQIGLL